MGLTTHVDMVYCVDVSESMSRFLESVKESITTGYRSLLQSSDSTGRNVSVVRIRVIAFRDLDSDTSQGLTASRFFVVEPDEDSRHLRGFLDGLDASGGGDEPESALEALGVAINSPWVRLGKRQRSVIVLLTDSSAHRLESRIGPIPAEFKDQIPASLDELRSWWDGGDSGSQSGATRIPQGTQRLILFAPSTYPWSAIADQWTNTFLMPTLDDTHGG